MDGHIRPTCRVVMTAPQRTGAELPAAPSLAITMEFPIHALRHAMLQSLSDAEFRAFLTIGWNEVVGHLITQCRESL